MLQTVIMIGMALIVGAIGYVILATIEKIITLIKWCIRNKGGSSK
jgi:hypothetical protein